MVKTPKEIEALKANWSNDPCYDIEDAEGFEEHRDELKAWRQKQEIEWQLKEDTRVLEKAEKMGVPGNTLLVRYIEALEFQIRLLEDRVNGL